MQGIFSSWTLQRIGCTHIDCPVCDSASPVGTRHKRRVSCTSRCIALAVSAYLRPAAPRHDVLHRCAPRAARPVYPSRRFGTLVFLLRRKPQARCVSMRHTHEGARQSLRLDECLRRRKASAHAASRSYVPCCTSSGTSPACSQRSCAFLHQQRLRSLHRPKTSTRSRLL